MPPNGLTEPGSLADHRVSAHRPAAARRGRKAMRARGETLFSGATSLLVVPHRQRPRRPAGAGTDDASARPDRAPTSSSRSASPAAADAESADFGERHAEIRHGDRGDRRTAAPSSACR